MEIPEIMNHPEKAWKRITELEQQLEDAKRENKEYSHIVARDVTTIFHLEQEVERLNTSIDGLVELEEKKAETIRRLRSALKREALFLRDCVTRWSGEYAGIGKAELATVVERLEQALPT
jgi:chromosome segregation ATPase